MSEPSTKTGIPAALANGLGGTDANLNIYGGNFYWIARDLNLSNVQVGGQLQVSSIVEEIIKMLKEYVDVKTWDIHQDISSKRTPDTGVTFRTRADVKKWIATLRSVFWATGGPGAGKTYLASAMFDELYTRVCASEDSAVAITYLRFNNRISAWEILMLLIIHLVECKPLPGVLELISQAFAEHRKRGSRPTLDQLSQLLHSIVKKYKWCYLLIDGLDEMTADIQALLIKIISTLKANIMLTSRVLDLVQEKFKELRTVGRPVFVTFAAQDEDLHMYISQIIADSPRLSTLLRDPKVKERLIAKIKKKAEGMFLHVALQMEAIKHCLDIGELFEVVEQFPLGIEALYSETMKRIERQPGSQGPRAKLALIWILHAVRPLTLDELQHALAAFPPDYCINPERLPSKQDLITICCGLLSVDKVSQRVGFVHLTAQEALWKLLSDDFPAPNIMMALTCLSQLAECGFKQGTHLSQLHDIQNLTASTPLLDYSYKSFADHCRLGAQEQQSSLTQVLEFVRSTRAFPYSVALLLANAPSNLASTVEIQHLQPIHLASFLGLSQVVRELVQEGINPDARAQSASGQGWTSLMLAAAHGRLEVVHYLLSLGEVRFSTVVDARGLTSLMLAASGGHEGVVRCLVEDKETTKPFKLRDASRWFEHKASKFVGKKASNKAKSFWADVIQQDSAGWTALTYARHQRHQSVVSLLEAIPRVENVTWQEAFPTNPPFGRGTPLERYRSDPSPAHVPPRIHSDHTGSRRGANREISGVRTNGTGDAGPNPSSGMSVGAQKKILSSSGTKKVDGPRAKALYSYTADPAEPCDLSLTKHEVLEVLGRYGNWWEVKKADVVPSNYLALESPSPAQGGPAVVKHRTAKALFQYTADAGDPDAVSFDKHEVLEVLDMEGKWWQVRKADGTAGIAPSNYLKLKESSSPKNPPLAPAISKAKALYSFTADPNEPQDISFQKHELFDVLDKQKNWWEVRKSNGTVGLAPSNYLELVRI